jgi:hypothetical protein
VIYASNVEQFLQGEPAWSRWMGNVRALPVDDASVLVRSWLGVPPRWPRHPRQLAGHATASFTQPVASFTALDHPPESAWSLVTEMSV